MSRHAWRAPSLSLSRVHRHAPALRFTMHRLRPPRHGLRGRSASHGSRFGGRLLRPATSGGPQLPSASPPLRLRSAAAPDAGTSLRLSEPFEDDGRGACPCHIGGPEVNGMSAFYCMHRATRACILFFFYGSAPIQASETLVCGAASRYPTQADPIFLFVYFIRVRALCSCRSHACSEAAC